MRQIQITKWGSYLGLLVSMALFQNFDYATILHVPLQDINEDVRTDHARELLGKKFRGSPAQKAGRVSDLHLAVHQEVYRRLPKRFQSQASKLTNTILEVSEQYDFDPVFVLAVIATESSFNPLAKGGVGEKGLMQIRPETAECIARRHRIAWSGPKQLEDPSQNVRIGVLYLSELRGRFNGYANKYISAYNMGAQKVRNMYASRVRPQIYSTRVLNQYSRIYEKLVAHQQPNLIAGNSSNRVGNL